MKVSSLWIGALIGSLLPLGVQADDRLAVAAMQRDLATVRQLLDRSDTDFNALGPQATPALHWLVHLEELDLTRRLLDAGADVNLRTGLGVDALSLAIENRDQDMVHLLLDTEQD